MAKVKVGVIGAGGIARSVHLPSLSEMDDVEVTAICDLVEQRAKDLAKVHGIPRTYVSLHDMLAKENLDAVWALVEPGNLFHVVWHSLHAGKHVFMEKPPGITSFQARSLARKAAEVGRFLQVGFNRRHVPVVREALARVRALGTVNQVEGCFFKYGDAAFDHGSLSAFVSDSIHAVDLVRWMAGGSPVSAALVEARYEDAVVNAWNGVVRFDNGVTGVIKANYRTGGRVHRFEVHAPGASAYIDLGTGESISCSASILTHVGDMKYSLAAAGSAQEKIEKLDGAALAGSPAFHRAYGFYHEDRHFVDCVLGKATPNPSIEDAAGSIELVEMLLANRI